MPEHASDAEGANAVECAALAGLVLDPWQELVLRGGLATRADWSWAAREAGVCVPRQNGKGGIIEALELYWLFVAKERLVIHSAHLFDTSKEAMRRLLDLIENVPDFDARVAKKLRSHGEEGIELKPDENGVRARIRFKTRTKSGGRGLTGPKVVLDEAMFLPDEVMGALMPVMSAIPDGQMWYFGSAVDEQVHPDGVTFARVRERGAAGDSGLAYFEWSVESDDPDAVTDTAWDDREAWAESNPAFGIRITDEAIASELRGLARRTFAVERLGVGAWPRTDGASKAVIDPKVWDALTDQSSVFEGASCLAFDTSPNRSRSTIAAVGRRPDGLYHVEIIDARRGTDWVPHRIAELAKRHKPRLVACDGVGPAASLIPDIEQLGVKVRDLSTQEHVQACGEFYDETIESGLRHPGSIELSSAVKGATQRSVGDAWGWSRKHSSVDITPLVAATFALWGMSQPAPVYKARGFK